MPVIWRCETFEQLSAARLYAMLCLRSEVFVVEQNCIFLDPDGLDPQALQLSAWDGERLLACARLLPPGLKAAEPVISRVVIAPSSRGSGLGHELNREAVAACERHWPGQGITLYAQAHLQNFYARAGFVPVGDPFDEDGILHQQMHKEPL